MKTAPQSVAAANEEFPLGWEDDDLTETESRQMTEDEKEFFAKKIFLELWPCKKYCPADKMAQAIGGSFTGEDVLDICNEPDHSINTFTMRGKEYIELRPFVQKLIDGMEVSFG